MSLSGLGGRLLLTGATAGVLLLFVVVVRAHREKHTDPSLSPRGWTVLLGVCALALLGPVFTVPGGRVETVLHVSSCVVFVLGLTRLVRGVGRGRLLAPVLSGATTHRART